MQCKMQKNLPGNKNKNTQCNTAALSGKGTVGTKGKSTGVAHYSKVGEKAHKNNRHGG